MGDDEEDDTVEKKERWDTDRLSVDAKNLKRSQSFSKVEHVRVPTRFGRSISGEPELLKYCECGKNLLEPAERKLRSYSCSSPQSTRSEPRFSLLNASMFRLEGSLKAEDNVDIEDVVEEPSFEDVADLVYASPKLVLEDDKTKTLTIDQSPAVQEVCENCLRLDCLAVRPTVGYYKVSQIQKHCTPDDCWITAHGYVYDVTRYIRKHPGGSRSILSRAGGDASADFDFHTNYSKKKIWTRYKIGKVAVCRNPKALTSSARHHVLKSPTGSSSPSSPNNEENCTIS